MEAIDFHPTTNRLEIQSAPQFNIVEFIINFLISRQRLVLSKKDTQNHVLIFYYVKFELRLKYFIYYWVIIATGKKVGYSPYWHYSNLI